MSSLQQRLRRRQYIEGLCAASIRALSGRRAVHYRGHRLFAGDRVLPVPAPHLRLGDDARLADHRGAADGWALRLLNSDAALHTAREPAEPVARLLFDWLEQLRVESLVPASLPGMRSNLAGRFESWSLAFHAAGHTQGDIGELLYTVIQVCCAALNGRPVVAATEGLIETRRGEIAPQLGHAFVGIRRARDDQAAFAEHALVIAAFVAERAVALRSLDKADDDERDRAAFSQLLDVDDTDVDAGFDTALSGRSHVFSAHSDRYRIFSREYDIEQPIEQALRAAQLLAFRDRLDRRVGELSINTRRWARYFLTRLSVPERADWQFGEEAGHIDGRRLAQVVTSPAERRVFKLEREQPRADAVVGVLLDCSGSMKTHGEFVALLVDRLTTALSLAGVTTEVLGFTTGAWSGGRVQQAWLRAGRPDRPGRLNERRHLIFKAADRPWRRARRHIGALLKPDLYREGFDGEAVDWACQRLSAHAAGRRILVVVSDGCPMDSATQLANDRFYLDNHLQQVVARWQRGSAIEICGLGLGLDLTAFYPRSVIVDPAAPIDNALMSEVAALLVGADVPGRGPT